MRKVIISAFVSLDGVMQAPGGPDEDRDGGFRFGGWTVPYRDDLLGASMIELFQKPFDLLLGRRTYDIFAAHWGRVAADNTLVDNQGEAWIANVFDRCTKHVATHSPDTLAWNNSKALGEDVVASVRELKRSSGPTLLTQGSSELLHILLASDLVDELRLLIYPVVLGQGKRLFDQAALPSSFKLTSTKSSEAGVMLATYARAGQVETGSYALKS